MVDIIDEADLASSPGVPEQAAGSTRLASLAAGASAVVQEAWLNPVDPVPVWVKNIAISVALRAMWNPKGLQMLSRQIDDAKRTEQYADEWVGSVGFNLTDSERSLLSGVVSGNRRVGTIRTVPGNVLRRF